MKHPTLRQAMKISELLNGITDKMTEIREVIDKFIPLPWNMKEKIDSFSKVVYKKWTLGEASRVIYILYREDVEEFKQFITKKKFLL